MTGSRAILLSIFAGALVIECIAMSVAGYRGVIYSSDVTNLIVKLLAVYSVHFAVMIGGIFATTRRSAARPTALARGIAFALASIWNLLLLVRIVAFAAADTDSIVELDRYLTLISAGGSFLVAGMLAYFFAK